MVPETGEQVTEYGGRTLDANSSVAVELDLDAGGMALAQATRWAAGHPNQVAVGVYGTEGGIEIDLEDSLTKLRHCFGKDRHRSAWTSVNLTPTPTNYQRFIASIASGEQDQADILRGAKVQAYLEACDRSVGRDGARVEVPALQEQSRTG